MNEDLIHIYLNDHLAGATAALEVARRSRASNSGNHFGSFLASLVTELEEDQNALEDIMDRLGVRRNPAKQAGAWLAEKVGRLKLNGRIMGYSDLSRLIELEGLTMGIEGKLSLWCNLSEVSAGDERLSGIAFEDLIARAERQRESLGENRLEGARVALDSS